MELTFFGQRAKRKACYVSLSKFILYITISLPFVASQTILTSSDWDWAVVHSKNVTFYTSKNVSHVLDVLVPPPVFPITIKVSANGSASINFKIGAANGLSNYSSGLADPTWNEQELGHIASDRTRNILFLLAEAEPNLTSIIMFNMTSNSSYVLIQSGTIHVDKLEFREDYLYWNERNIRSNLDNRNDKETNTNQGIWRLNTKNEISSWKAQLYFQSKQKLPIDFTVDPTTGTLYWVGRSTGTAKIHAFDGLTNRDVITTGLFQPHALTTDCSYLYWADYPTSREFVIRRAELRNLNNSTTVHRGFDHSVISVAALNNSTVVWSESNFITMWLRKDHLTKKYEIPYEDGLVQPKGITSSYCSQDARMNLVTTPLVRTEQRKTLPGNSSVSFAKSISSSPIISSVVEKSEKSPLPTKTVPKFNNVPDETDTTNDTQADQANATLDPIVSISNVTEKDQFSSSSSSASPENVATKFLPLNLNHGDEPHPKTPIQEEEYIKGHYNVVQGNVDENPTSLLTNLPLRWCSKDDNVICFNGGSCLHANSVKICLCPNGFGGPKCEIEIIDGNREAETSACLASDIAYPIVCSVLSFLVVILSIVSTYLFLRVRELGKKPRIRRRLIVSRAADSERSSVCEMVDIENCCNMNECETPCYERGSSSSSYASRAKLGPLKGTDTRKEDCQRLVDS